MIQRFAAMWLVLAMLAMSAHALVAQSLPTLTGLLVTVVFLMPCAAVAARLNRRIVTICVAVMAQAIAHFSFGVPSFTLSGDLHGAHQVHLESADLMQIGQASVHGHLTPAMLATHIVSAIALSMILHRIDDFLSALSGLLAVFIPQQLIAVVPRYRPMRSDTTVVSSLCSRLFSRFHPRRGPPLPLFV